MVTTEGDWDGLRMPNLKKLASFFKLRYPWRSSFKAASLRLVSSVSVCVCTVTNKTIFNAENRCKFNWKHRLAITRTKLIKLRWLLFDEETRDKPWLRGLILSKWEGNSCSSWILTQHWHSSFSATNETPLVTLSSRYVGLEWLVCIT